MAYFNDILKALALVGLLLISLQPFTISAVQHLIQSIDYSQSQILQALEAQVNLKVLLQDDAVAHPVAVLVSVAAALYINKFVQMALYQMHLLVYESNAVHVSWIVIENLWIFVFCTGSPLLMLRLTFWLTLRFLGQFCPFPSMQLIAEVAGLCLFLVTFSITEEYPEYRAFEIEMMAIPPNLNPKTYR